jgi:hypothetical protein
LKFLIIGYDQGMLDVRCDVTLDLTTTSARCQLYAGHESDHAHLVLRGGNRMLRHWGLTSVGYVAFGSDIPAQYAWAPGFPSLAEAAEQTEDTDATLTEPPTEPAAGSVAIREPRRLHSVA